MFTCQVGFQQHKPVVGLASVLAEAAECPCEGEIVLGVLAQVRLRSDPLQQIDDELDFLPAPAVEGRPDVLDHLSGDLDFRADVEVLFGQQFSLKLGAGAQVLASVLAFGPAEDVEILHEFLDAVDPFAAEHAQQQRQGEQETPAGADKDHRKVSCSVELLSANDKSISSA
ncbi:hypothetical protein SALBM311S_12182 [Streptomyces alboniger]